MIFDFEPWQLDIDIDLTKQLYRSMIFQFLKVYQNNIAVISKINCSLSVRRKRCKNVLIRLAVKARGSEV